MIKINAEFKKNGFNGEWEPEFTREMSSAMEQSLALLEREVRRNEPNDRGTLRTGTRGILISPLRGIVGVIGPAERYAEVMEKGRRPNKRRPPIDVIMGWLKRTDKGKAFVRSIKEKYKIKKKTTALKSAAFLKARAIGKKGIRGKFMFKNAEIELKPKVNEVFSKAINALEQRFRG